LKQVFTFSKPIPKSTPSTPQQQLKKEPLKRMSMTNKSSAGTFGGFSATSRQRSVTEGKLKSNSNQFQFDDEAEESVFAVLARKGKFW
jgi:hypothetical protein